MLNGESNSPNLGWDNLVERYFSLKYVKINVYRQFIPAASIRHQNYLVVKPGNFGKRKATKICSDISRCNESSTCFLFFLGNLKTSISPTLDTIEISYKNSSYLTMGVSQF